MSEQLHNKSPEQGFENIEAPELKSPVETLDTPEQKAEQLESIRQEVQEAAPAKERLALPVDDSADGNRPQYIDRELRVIGLYRSLKQVRRQLPFASRALSRVIHQPLVRAVSDASAKTITRPSGLLGGGIFAFLGSLAYLYLAKHIGFTYNYLLFALFFAGGFVIGLLLELLLFVLRPKHQEQNN